ncbi:MAG TPA: HDOD domain-containing protein [Pyrinomonadaceae bacterium]|nr:HDOD domain-containing protein [Pyrinomonadaceae bacterium]
MQTFIARQPIFDRQQKVFAYELLFRSGETKNYVDRTDLDQISSKVIADSCLLLNVEDITAGKKAFVNVTRDVLMGEYFHMLPVGLTAVELLETIEPDEAVIKACRGLKAAGYTLALDDFVYSEKWQALVELADIIKVDFLTTTSGEQKELVDKFTPLGVRFLAEKVETQEVFQQAVGMGYHYFQGYFFCRPVILSNKDISGSKLQYVRILQEIHRAELDFRRLEQIIKLDLSLSYKLLRYINSASLGRRNTISSIKQALDLLGEREIKRWVSLIALAGMSTDKPEELVTHAVIRAKFCELLAPSFRLESRAEDLFLMGMFSLVDAILDRELKGILVEMPIDEDIKLALLGETSDLKKVYDYMLDYEKADWERLVEKSGEMGFTNAEATLPRLYLNAVNWAEKSFVPTVRAK